jgi:hypothetical protein
MPARSCMPEPRSSDRVADIAFQYDAGINKAKTAEIGAGKQ